MKAARSAKNGALSLRSFERFNKLLAVLAISMVAAPYFYTFLCRTVPLPSLVSLLCSLLLVFGGFALQALWSRILGIKPEGASTGYEDFIKRFDPAAASLPILIAIGCGIGTAVAAKAIMKAIAESTPGVLYDPRSLVPALIGLLAGAGLFLGIFLWFFPYNRILSMRTLLPLCLAYLLNFLLNIVFGGIPTGFLALSFACFAVVSLLLLNQSYVIRSIDRSGNGRVSSDVLKFNGSLVGILILLFLALALIMLLIMSGVTVLGRLVLFGIHEAAISAGGSDDRDWEEKSDDFVNITFGEKDGGAFMIGQNALVGLFMLFILFVIAAIGIFLLFRFRKSLWVRFKAFLTRTLSNLLHFIRTALDIWKNAPMDEEEDPFADNYVDTSIRMEKTAAADRPITSVPRNYRATLATMQDPKERNRYLYRLLIARWEHFLTIEPSDTPDEILGKTSARLENPHLPTITALFIRFRYAGEGHRPDEEESHVGEEIMCEMLDGYEKGQTDASS